MPLLRVDWPSLVLMWPLVFYLTSNFHCLNFWDYRKHMSGVNCHWCENTFGFIVSEAAEVFETNPWPL